MFSGIIEESGRIAAIVPTDRSIGLVVEASRVVRGVHLGDSIAVNGCCLTVVKVSRLNGVSRLHFDLLAETWKRTNFKNLGVGASVNLERALKLQDRLGGHFVTGHIDGVATVTRWEKSGQDWILGIRPPAGLMRYFLNKGSIALDGISLTIAEVTERNVCVWIIPHTREVTNLRERKVGDGVNIEADLLGKYVERLIGSREPSPRRRQLSSSRARSPGRASR